MASTFTTYPNYTGGGYITNGSVSIHSRQVIENKQMRYGANDVVGCCLDRSGGTGFFTKSSLKVADFSIAEFSGVALHPSFTFQIGPQGASPQLSYIATANFGQKPFKYDLDRYSKVQPLV
jgi:hypothetical protein